MVSTLLVSGLSFLLPLSFVFSKGSKAFFPTVQLLTGTLTSKKYDRAIKHSDKKGAKPARAFNAFAFASRKFDRVRTIVAVAVVVIRLYGPGTAAITTIVDFAKRRVA